MNPDLAVRFGQERLKLLRQEANTFSQLKALFGSRQRKKVESLEQFEQRQAAT